LNLWKSCARQLGPLDSQTSRKQKADFPVDRSCLDVFQALGQLKRHALESFDDLVRSVAEKSGMRGEDVCRIGTEFAARICKPLYTQIDPASSRRGNPCNWRRSTRGRPE
jgi:hypothetical protein